jgi:FlaA1/EpsC-like NDP-sugar epimerase
MQTTIITGATGGIGQALARELSQHHLVLLGRDAQKLEQMCQGFPSAESVVLELRQPEAFAKVLARLERIDNLVHNAATVTLGTVEDTALEMWRTMVHHCRSGMGWWLEQQTEKALIRSAKKFRQLVFGNQDFPRLAALVGTNNPHRLERVYQLAATRMSNTQAAL